MRKAHSLLFSILLVIIVAPCLSFAQQSNQGEDYTAYMPEVRQFNKLIGSGKQPPSLLTKEGVEASRKGMKAFITKSTGIQPIETTIPGPAGDIPVRIFRPDTIKAVALDIHGGGWFQGVAASDDAFNDLMARECKIAIVSVDYRLAPESPFPASIEDCKAAAKWLANNAKEQFGTDKIFLTGQSAGAHLSGETALYIRDSLHAINKVIGINFQYGCFDLGGTPSERAAADTTLILTKTTLAENFQLVFGGWSIEKLRQPAYSPLYADVHGMPPAYFIVGTADPLLDDTKLMEAKWREAGNKTYLAIYPECPHGLNIFPTKLAKLANKSMFDWMKARIGG